MSATYELIAPCFFGCESTASFELRRLGAEDLRVTDGRLTFRRQKGLRMHCGCVFSPAPGLVMSQNPWAVVKRRADLTLVLPGGTRWNVRSIPLDDGERCAQFLEE